MRLKFSLPTLGLVSLGCCVFAGCSSPEKTTFPNPDLERVKQRAESDLPFKSTHTGLKFRIHREGNGNVPRPTDRVVIQYRGWFDDGTEFDSTYSDGLPATFQVAGVVAGFAEGLMLVSEGGVIELEIPPDLGYGPYPPQGMRANATLHFDIELLKIK